MHRSDPNLINACLAGDARAWDEVIERYGRLVYSVPRRYGLQDSDVEDIFQAVFSLLFQKLDQLRDQTRLSAWLITTTHRECWRVGRESRRAGDFVEQIDDVSAPDPDDAERWERQHVVREALRTLGDPCEGLLTAMFLATGEPNYEALAATLGMPVGSIGPTRARCFRKLERLLIKMEFDPDSVGDPGR